MDWRGGDAIGCWHIVQEGRDVSPFRICSSDISLPGGRHLLLCSGYVQEDLWKYDVTKDIGLLEAISVGCKGGGSVVIIAGQNANDDWRKAHECFVMRLEQKAALDGFSVRKRRTSESAKWHAKIAMKLTCEENQMTSYTNAKPMAAIIGSSNLTRPACQAPAKGLFNHECDVVLWNDEESTVKSDLLKGANEIEEQTPSSVIVATVDYLGLTNQLSEQEHLEHLLKQIWESTEEAV